MTGQSPLLSVRNASKHFPGTMALDGVNFDLLPGEVHILLGENGAGKSTLIKMLSGIYSPTAGEIVLEGTSFRTLSPAIARAHGVRVIYQDLSVNDQLSVMENLFLGELPVKRRLGLHMVDFAAMRRESWELLASVGLQCHPKSLLGTLSVAGKQQVEIAKALRGGAKVLILDEPTSSLSPVETEKLLGLLMKLRAQGTGIIYISHRLEELKAIGDRVTVLKDGRSMGTYDVRSLDTKGLIELMVGRDVDLSGPKQIRYEGKTKLEVKGLSSRDGRVRNISFTVRAGEILGFAGLVGAGRSELMETIFGARKKLLGELRIDGKIAAIENPTDAVRAGVGFVTEDRRGTGFFPNFSIAENITTVAENRRARGRFPLRLVRGGARRDIAETYRQKLQVRCSSIEQKLTKLSGGNQQKAIIAKWLAAGTEILVLDEPTRGIDAGSRAEIYTLVRQLALEGKAVLLVSSDLPEMLLLADRVAVFREGTIAGFLEGAFMTEQNVMAMAIGDAQERSA